MFSGLSLDLATRHDALRDFQITEECRKRAAEAALNAVVPGNTFTMSVEGTWGTGKLADGTWGPSRKLPKKFVVAKVVVNERWPWVRDFEDANGEIFPYGAFLKYHKKQQLAVA